MQILPKRIAQFGALLLVALMLSACGNGLAGSSAANEEANRGPATKPQAKHLSQDPALRITTAEVMKLFKEVYGDKPLTKATLESNDRFLLVDARPLGRYQEGHVPGAIHMPPGEVAANMDKLPRDRTVIFYCGGLHCPLSPKAAKIAMEHGLTNVRVWYEGDPGWHANGGYMVSETPYVYHMMGQTDKENVLLIDARPSKTHRKAFIPGSISVPVDNLELKKSLLPRDTSTKLIFYCGGHGCPHSHKSAVKAKEMGYKWVTVYSAGEPEWKEQGLPLWGNEPSGVVEAAPASLPVVLGSKLPRTISAEEFKKLMAESAGSVTILDVRSADEFAAGHLPGAINLPDDKFHANYDALVGKVPTGKRVVIHCVTGIRAEGVYHALATRGKYENPKGVQFLNANISIAKDGSFNVH